MKHKKLKISLISAAVAIFMLVASLTVYAYFTTRVYVYTEDGKEVAHVGMNLQLLFGKLDTTVTAGTDLKIPSYNVVDANGADVTDDKGNWIAIAGDGQYLHYNDGVNDKTLYDPDAPWGSAQNPYVISESRHLQNLSALQSVGYFDMLYIGDNYTSGNYNDGSASIPYFVICETDGTPVNIDGSEINVPIKPIGSAEHPFIGVIGGAFKDGTTTVAVADDGTGGKLSSVSAIDNFKVKTNTDQVDVGLFGYIGYMGTEPEETETESGTETETTTETIKTFPGVVSVVKNVLVSDVQVIVENPSPLEVASDLLSHVFNMHNFTFGQAKAGVAQEAPHEDHHIGIFAGHVSYAHLEYISVYYSEDNLCAMDLLHADTNYHSSTGIIGFMHNMNSTITNQTNGNCLISIGGVSSSGVNLTPDTPGTGGGKEIGLGRGYVVAKTLYEGCHYIKENQALGDRVWQYKVNASDTWSYAMMFFQQPNTSPAAYVDMNGNPATVDAAAKTVTVNNTGKVYSKYILRNITSGDGSTDSPYVYSYVLNDGTTIPSTYCREVSQTVWQFAAAKPTTSNVPDWVDAVMVYETGVDTGVYQLEDKVTNITVVENSDGTYSATITGADVYSGSTNLVTISRVIFNRYQSTDKYTCSMTPTGDIQAPYVYREKPLLIKSARTMNGTELCIESTEGLSLGGGEGNYYFYDGVFTFALSSPQDTIESNWENNTPDKIVLGGTANEDWISTTYKDNFSVVAFIQKITDVGQLAKAQGDGKDIFIGYYESATDNIDDWTGGSLSVMSLATRVDPSSGLTFQDDHVTAEANVKSFLSQKERAELIEALQDNPANADLLSKIDHLQMLNLQTAQDLETLKNKFRIKVEVNGTTYTFSSTIQGYKLGLLEKRGWLSGSHFSIWCGEGEPSSTFGYDYYFDTGAEINDGTVNGTFTIKYNLTDREGEPADRYVNFGFNEDGVPVFNGVQTAQTTSNLCFYVIEEMAIVPMGYVNYSPAEGATNLSFDADKYILWPKAVMTQAGTLVTPMDSFIPGDVQTGTGYHDAGDIVTDGNATTADIFKTYKLVGLDQLVAGDNGWQDGSGYKLSYKTLRQKFTMQHAMDFSISLKIPNIPNIQVNNNSVLAPVGPGGALANVPTGSIAFRINKEGESTIRVIVSVPVSQFVDGEADGLATNVDYYLGLWKTEDLVDNEWSLNTFSQTSAEQKFELPRSRPYEPGTAAADADYILVEHEGETYRCYLNGNRILVGYEFTVTEAGTYILGTAAGSAPILGIFGEDTTVDYPMEIVYCAADGTASPGRDGTSGSVFGAIDYVYDYQGNIIHVQDYATAPDTENNTKYSFYYNSHIITYTDNEYGDPNFVAINNMMIYPRRYISSSTVSTVSIRAYGPNAVQFKGKHAGVDTDDLYTEYYPARPTS